MFIILSQKIDAESSYDDELFHSYHYPSRYRNQLHKGDVFIYYQGNRYDRTHRYYFGTGRIGEIITTDEVNYYAELVDCQRFESKVPIYLPDGGYAEQLGYETVRKSINPPWQSSVRPLSQQAYDYILDASGILHTKEPKESVDVLKEKLKTAVREFYVEERSSAILRIENIAAAIAQASNIFTDNPRNEGEDALVEHAQWESTTDKLTQLMDYCSNMKMTYSYKPILILALLKVGDANGKISISAAVNYFREYYETRKNHGLCVERKPCIYQRQNTSDKQIEANLIANPVKALLDSGLFFYDDQKRIFSMHSEAWGAMEDKDKSILAKICRQRLKMYYLDTLICQIKLES